MHILVMYESQRGHTRQAAEAIGSAARDLGYDVLIKPVDKIQEADINHASALFIGTWVQGLIFFGTRPAGAADWGAQLPFLKQKPVGVFCTYRFNPRGVLAKMSRIMKTCGAVIRGEHAFRSDHPGEGAAEFVQSVLYPAAAR